MEIREIFDTIESDSNMDEELQRDILEKIDNIARADKLVDGLEEKIEEHKDELSEKELKYIINKCISYKSVFYRFRNGGIVDYDQLNDITSRIFALEESIRVNDFAKWKQELLEYKGSKEDKEEDKMLKNMLMVIPEETNVVEKVTRMFKRAFWKIKQKSQKHKEESEEVIELPQNTFVDLAAEDESLNPNLIKDEPIEPQEEIDEEEALEEKFGDDFIEQEETTEEPMAEEVVEDTTQEITQETPAEVEEEQVEVIEEEPVKEAQEIIPEPVEEAVEYVEETIEEQPKRRRAAVMNEETKKEEEEKVEEVEEAPKKRVRKAVQKKK
ncbi:MAG: hypothetical protein IKD74_06965 [Clostridia bacterium]|nr:hypothetical protein [Clostridia bacterium]